MEDKSVETGPEGEVIAWGHMNRILDYIHMSIEREFQRHLPEAGIIQALKEENQELQAGLEMMNVVCDLLKKERDLLLLNAKCPHCNLPFATIEGSTGCTECGYALVGEAAQKFDKSRRIVAD